MDIPFDEFDGKVVYGQKRTLQGIVNYNKVNFIGFFGIIKTVESCRFIRELPP